jgi:hypothetical protein
MRFSLFFILLSFVWIHGGYASSKKDCYPGLLTLLHKGGENGEEFSLTPDDGFFPQRFLVASKLDSMPETVRLEPILEDTVSGFRPNKPSKNQVRMKVLQNSKGTRGSQSKLLGSVNYHLNPNGFREIQEFSLNRSGLEQNDEIFGNFSYSYMQTGQRNPEIQNLTDFNQEILSTEEDVTLQLAFSTDPHLVSLVKHVIFNLIQGMSDRGSFVKSKTEVATIEDLKVFIQSFEKSESAKSILNASEINNEQMDAILAGLFPHVQGRIGYEMKTNSRIRQIHFKIEAENENYNTITFEFDEQTQELLLTASSHSPSGVTTEMTLKFENPDLNLIKTRWLNQSETVVDGSVKLEWISKIFNQNGHYSSDFKTFFIDRGVQGQRSKQKDFVSVLIPRKLPEVFQFADRAFKVVSVEKAKGFDVQMAREFLEKGFVYADDEKSFLDSKIVFENGQIGFVFRTEYFEPNVTDRLFSSGVPMYRVFIPNNLHRN